ncbi:MAG: zinc-ribbon domain-containing protein [Nitrospinae bacterium]|nr:zinc-ribbon domain-containing protein [Nitrospinota bacterium]
MQIKCTSCEHPINLPDEKVPKGKAFTITCPKCKAKIHVDQHLKAETPVAAPPPKEETVDTTSFAVSQEEFDDDDEDLVIYDDDDKLALVLDDKNKDLWVKALEELEYKIQFAKSPAHAVHKMKFTRFDLVALHENFGNVALAKSPAYNSIIEMPMSQRRHIFVALLGDQFKTLNNMQAFTTSVNVVINQKDIAKLLDVLKKSIKENEIFYKVYKETLHTMGKA